MKTIKSQWMPISIKPAYEGWYEMSWLVGDSGFPVYWNGFHWGYWMDKARKHWVHQLTISVDYWRGKL